MDIEGNYTTAPSLGVYEKDQIPCKLPSISQALCTEDILIAVLMVCVLSPR